MILGVLQRDKLTDQEARGHPSPSETEVEGSSSASLNKNTSGGTSHTSDHASSATSRLSAETTYEG